MNNIGFVFNLVIVMEFNGGYLMNLMVNVGVIVIIVLMFGVMVVE